MKLVWVIQAYKTADEVTGNLTDLCTLELFGKNEKEVIERAKSLVKKSYYRVGRIIETKE